MNTGRVAGLWYISMVFVAPFSLMYVPKTLIVRGDASATASRILASETMFRLSIVAELITATVSIFLLLALYRLLGGVDRKQGVLMVIFGALMSAPISFLNTVNDIAALVILRAEFLSRVFSRPQIESLAMLFIRLHGYGITVVAIFWGLWLLPFGILVMKSGFIPRILGLLLIVNGVAYVVVSLTSLIVPAYSSAVANAAFIAYTGELWIMLWLLIKGANVEPAPEPAFA